VAGVTVNVAAGESAATITNHVVTAMQSAFPSRTFVANGDKISMTYALAEGDGPPVMLKVTNKKPVTGTSIEAVKGSLGPVLMQGLSISPKGEVMATYTNGSIYTMGFVAIATFPNEGGLKDVGGNRFIETGDSGGHTITPAGAPKAGNIMSGALEQANVDITSELMEMIRAQQVYNGNARVLQTTVDTVTKITDMR
jgi:flagellar hook-basal body protein